MAKVINPYNFVPFGKAPDRAQSENDLRVNTGWLDVTITPKTGLIIPDGANPDPNAENQHKSFKFFRLNGKPAIPGSSLRGMARSAFEAASNSCLPFLRDKEELTMRTPVCAAFKHRGLLHFNNDGKWELYDVKKETVNGKQFEGACVGTIPDDELYRLNYGKWNGLENASAYNGGTLQFHKPPAIPRGKCYHIRSLTPINAPIMVWTAGDDSPYESMLAALEATVKNSQNNGRCNTHGALLDALKAVKKHKDSSRFIPVWYLKVGDDEYHLSPSAIGRVHQRSWEKIMGAYGPCKELDKLCPACRLFGTVEGGGAKGRVRFTDALFTGERPIFDTITLDILAEPKPTAYEFYLRRPAKGAATFWNYNYYSVKTPEGYEYKPLADAKFPQGRLMPRGRKFYWHKLDSVAKNSEPGRMNSTMQFLKPDGASFSFRIYFDGITDQELRQLQWIVNLGENDVNGKLCHKLGHARPLGFGSVKLTIDGITLRRLAWQDGSLAANLVKTAAPAEAECPWRPDSPQIKALLAMANTGATSGIPVAYPMSLGKDGKPAIYEWFSQNRSNRGVAQVLPNPTAEDLSIESYLEEEAAVPAAEPEQRPAADTVKGTIIKINRNAVTIKLEGMDANGYFINASGVPMKEGSGIVVRLKSREKNAHGNYDVEYVRHC